MGRVKPPLSKEVAMAVRNKELIPSTTSAVTSTRFSVGGTITVMCGELIAGENITIQQTHNGTEWQTIILNGISQTITLDHTQITINGPGMFRCLKSETASAISVNLWKTDAEQ